MYDKQAHRDTTLFLEVPGIYASFSNTSWRRAVPTHRGARLKYLEGRCSWAVVEMPMQLERIQQCILELLPVHTQGSSLHLEEAASGSL